MEILKVKRRFWGRQQHRPIYINFIKILYNDNYLYYYNFILRVKHNNKKYYKGDVNYVN